jgi:transposase
MIVIGVDAHKRTHTMVAVDAGGRQLGEKTVAATTAGHLAALRWAHTEFGLEVL